MLTKHRAPHPHFTAVGNDSKIIGYLNAEIMVSSQPFNSREDPLVTSLEDEELPRMVGYPWDYFVADLVRLDKKTSASLVLMAPLRGPKWSEPHVWSLDLADGTGRRHVASLHVPSGLPVTAACSPTTRSEAHVYDPNRDRNIPTRRQMQRENPPRTVKTFNPFASEKPASHPKILVDMSSLESVVTYRRPIPSNAHTLRMASNLPPGEQIARIVTPVSHARDENMPRQARPRARVILALEASLLENRTAARSAVEARSARREERRLARVPMPFPMPPPSANITGWRRSRFTPLKHGDLWKGGQGPPVQLPASEHHKCGICHHVKSHPVSHCYVCIRLWLERSWNCPECIRTMACKPFRQYAEESWIAEAYPNWKDESHVDYSWDGLSFPVPQ
ncbi:hypothetical protein DFH08DRAFT_827483 [Mycena albidolilacea]|uniref:Uncharacterized protein n=1 Tax=Mycena albidolilacea TaxID=1033008 RepID=A0AAD6YY31_9AGAR|nr:hypothetical protein DFH08DRAFT_827483 [Mycena albidolilacea]